MTKRLKDSDLLSLPGAIIDSPRHADVRYRLERAIGQGAQGVVFLARQEQPSGERAVVVKVLRPRVVRALAAPAPTAISKEVGALERLSEREPPTPFVVRFFDTGTLRVQEQPLELPWVALEYVDGGADGVTLRARVEGCIASSGSAFDLERARRAAHATVAGISAIHEVGVIHRDVNPGNVLCSGAGDSESFKISDFGLARVSTVSTYGDVLLGTPGYCAPEQSFPEKIGVGPYSDVFGLACTLYFVLTGETYFDAPTIPETLVAAYHGPRPSLLQAEALCAEARSQPALCAELDALIARATHADPKERPQSAEEFGTAALGLIDRHATANHR